MQATRNLDRVILGSTENGGARAHVLVRLGEIFKFYELKALRPSVTCTYGHVSNNGIKMHVFIELFITKEFS